ncbi:MAG: hypothetical protein Q4G13_07125 [Moraxella sp.]|nr:hypothetical protein [Moraxella sp.]
MNVKHIISAIAISAAVASVPAHAAIEIDESQPFGPTYGSAMADTTIAKPLQLAGAVLGTAAYVVAFPFAVASGSVDSTFEAMVATPWNALGRCVGCTEAYDNYRNSRATQGQVRFVVDQPSEIVINTNEQVIVTP